MTVRPQKSEFEQAIARDFPLRVLSLPGDEALRERRRRAFAHFEDVGLPTRRDEDYHYTDLKALMPPPHLSLLEPTALAFDNPADPVSRLAGRHHRLIRGSLQTAKPPRGVEVYSFERAMRERPDLIGRIGEAVADDASALVALNTAFFSGLAIVVVEDGVSVELPLHAGYTYRGGLPLRIDSRALYIVGDGATLTMVNSVTGDDAAGYQANSVVELILGEGAKMNHIRSDHAGAASLVMHTIAVKLAARAEYNLFVQNVGVGLSRTEVRVTFAGPGGKCGLRGVNLLRGDQHCDVTLMVDHAAPNCESRELFRHVVADSARGVFQGKISVRQAAQKTDGQMASNAILLSDDAEMNNKPELEIFADDVVCAHGATCGALDDDLLFYLQARGLPREEAEALMIQAFCGEAIDFVEDETVRDALNECVADWLSRRNRAA